MSNPEQVVRLDNWMGHVLVVRTHRYEKGCIVFGGYFIEYDSNGNEKRRSDYGDVVKVFL